MTWIDVLIGDPIPLQPDNLQMAGLVTKRSPLIRTNLKHNDIQNEAPAQGEGVLRSVSSGQEEAWSSNQHPPNLFSDGGPPCSFCHAAQSFFFFLSFPRLPSSIRPRSDAPSHTSSSGRPAVSAASPSDRTGENLHPSGHQP